MPDLSPTASLDQLRGVGPARSASLAAAGFLTPLDLLLHLPVRYEDRRRAVLIADLDAEGGRMLCGRLYDLRRVRLRRRNLTLVRGRLEDASGQLPVIWFNRPYLMKQVTEGKHFALYGEIRRRGGGYELVNPSCEPAEEPLECGRVIPVYPASGGLGSSLLRRLIRQVLDRLDWAEIEDPMPRVLRSRHGLPALREALVELHDPPDDSELWSMEVTRSAARARLSYGEFLELQVELALLRGLETRQRKGHRYRLDDRTREVLKRLLPFRLTGAQRRVLREITADLGSSYPMLRLLQGDVGSGKTIVAALALVMAIESGLQGAFMAPTELLAEQHGQTLGRLLGHRYQVDLLTSSVETAERVRRRVEGGETQLLVGTHALIQGEVAFRRLGLAVVDEQHRFGVAQRQLLQQKGHCPDMLVMTATPIPRSLAMTVYGDLAFSMIDELPPGRTPVTTRVVPSTQRKKVYLWLRQELERGAQAYVVFPLIEESEQLKVESIASMGQALRSHLRPHASAVLHGRIAASEREAIMQRFHRGEIKVLVATTVIEVGLDVANASIMIIENAERFGLAQLHQLRGRVGRGRRQSHCVALHGRLTEVAKRRLQVFEDTVDGFQIAEADLEIRGPGDLLGTRQSGLPLFRVADILRDRSWLEKARGDARELLAGHIEGDDAEAFVDRVRQRAQSRYDRFSGG